MDIPTIYLTERRLADWGACLEQRDLFEQMYPSGIELTPENIASGSPLLAYDWLLLNCEEPLSCEVALALAARVTRSSHVAAVLTNLSPYVDWAPAVAAVLVPRIRTAEYATWVLEEVEASFMSTELVDMLLALIHDESRAYTILAHAKLGLLRPQQVDKLVDLVTTSAGAAALLCADMASFYERLTDAQRTRLYLAGQVRE